MSFLTIVAQTDPNTFFGYLAGSSAQINPNALQGVENTLIGYRAGELITTGSDNVALGHYALNNADATVRNVAIGSSALRTNNQGNDNIAIGADALLFNVFGPQNVAIGTEAQRARTDGQDNIAIGFRALRSNTTGDSNIAIGGGTLFTTSGRQNVFVGSGAGEQLTTGERNAAFGHLAGGLITTGNKNSILGSYSGNQGGLDIRTLSNYIVLSDGDGNPRLWIDNTGAMSVPGGGSISGSLTITGGTVTANNPVLQATQTWNNAAVLFTGWRLNITDTASAANSLLLDLQTGGSSRFEVTAKSTDPFIGRFSNAGIERVRFSTQGSGASVELFAGASNSFIGFGPIGASDARLYRDDPNALAQRIGVSPQAFRVYSTYTDISNYERAAFSWSGGQFNIATEAAGTGTGRNLSIVSAATLFMSSPSSEIYFQTGGVSRWRVSNGGTFFPHQDNAVDIGFSGNRPRAGWFGSELMVGGTISAGSETIDVLSGTKAPQFAASTQTNNGFAAVVAAVRDGANNRRAGIYVDDSDATWGLASKYSSGGADFVLVNNSQRMITATAAYNVIIGAGAIATNATDGFFYIPSCAGTPTGAPTAFTGRVPLVVDTTNNKLYFYSGGAWRDAGP